MGKPCFEKTVYFHRNKEDNWDVVDEAEQLGFSEKAIDELKYLGYEIAFKVRVTQDDNDGLVVDILESPDEI